MKIVGVTKCPTGIAHTYMAAERLEKIGPKLGYEVKVETQGSQGTENRLTKKEIAQAEYVIIAADVVIDEPERFRGKKVFKTRIKPLLKNTESIFERLEEEYFIMDAADAAEYDSKNDNKNNDKNDNRNNNKNIEDPDKSNRKNQSFSREGKRQKKNR